MEILERITKWAESALKAEKSDWKQLGPTLKKIREDLDMTAAQLCIKVSVTIPTIFRWESGKSKIPASKVRAIKGVLMNAVAQTDPESGEIKGEILWSIGSQVDLRPLLRQLHSSERPITTEMFFQSAFHYLKLQEVISG